MQEQQPVNIKPAISHKMAYGVHCSVWLGDNTLYHAARSAVIVFFSSEVIMYKVLESPPDCLYVRQNNAR